MIVRSSRTVVAGAGVKGFPRTSCCLKSRLLNFSPRTPFITYFGKPLMDLLLNFDSEKQD